MNTLDDALASRRGRVFACVIVGVLVILTACAIPYAPRLLAPIPAWMTVFLTLSCAADALTSYLFVITGRVGKSLSRLMLAAGYAYSSIVIALHALVFPSVFSPTGLLGADSQSAVWFWVAWHGGFPLFVIAYVLAQRTVRDTDSRNASPSMLAAVATVVAGIVTLVALIVLRGDRALPILIHKGQYNLLVTTGVGGGVFVSILLALVALVALTRLRRGTDLWLAVAIAASLMDCVLTLIGTKRFTLGWDVARVESLVTSTIVLLNFLRGLDVVLRKLALLSNVDGLTGLANRRAFDDDVACAVATCTRADRPLTVLMIDVDAFKIYNDTYGHQGGDQALRAVAGCVAQTAGRRSDRVARYGGEEFAVVLPMTDCAGAAKIADRIRLGVVRLGIEHRGSPLGVVSVSVGIATLSGPHLRARDASERLIALADGALYRAKRLGRNRIEASDPEFASAVGDESPRLRLVSADRSGRSA